MRHLVETQKSQDFNTPVRTEERTEEHEVFIRGYKL